MTASPSSPAPRPSLSGWGTGPGRSSESGVLTFLVRLWGAFLAGRAELTGPLSLRSRGPAHIPDFLQLGGSPSFLIPTEKRGEPARFKPRALSRARDASCGPARCSNPRESSFRRLKQTPRSTPPPRGVEVVVIRGQYPCQAAAGCNPADAGCLRQGPHGASVTTYLLPTTCSASRTSHLVPVVTLICDLT